MLLSHLEREKIKEEGKRCVCMQAVQMGQMAGAIGLPQSGSESKGPEKRFRAGAVSATVWKNDRQRATGEAFSYHTVSLDRRYKDQTGNWKSASSLRLQDLPKAALVLNEAFRYLSLSGTGSEEVVVE
jgi:hypothetical protein